jgi:cyclic pyranopterin phosphate synthase
VSLDTFRKDRFAEMTRRDLFERTLRNIELLLNEGFRVKINCVVMKGVNDDELEDFVRYSIHRPVHVRFIEFMPFAGNGWNSGSLLTAAEIIERVRSKMKIEKLVDGKHDTTRAYRISGAKGTFAVISTMSEPFCGGCNRLRLTAEGRLKNCLFSQGETDLLGSLRRGEDVLPHIRRTVESKALATGGLDLHRTSSSRSMISIGG